jgi:sulfite exporter TauE/SafE
MWLTALIIGFAGSFHCAGMCSPLVMAATSMRPHALLSRSLYNGGRIFTYALIGAPISAAGALLPLGNFQNVASLALGTILLFIALTGSYTSRIPFLTHALMRLTTFLKIRFGMLLQRKGYVATGLLGMLNGLLPCGLTTLALSYCITLQGPLDGFNFMLLFGLGTLPAMIGLPSLIQWTTRSFHISPRTITTCMLIVSGGLLIARVFLMHGVPGAAPEADIVLCR